MTSVGGEEHDKREIARGLATELSAHPLTRRFALKIHATGDNRVYTAADVLGERLLRLIGLLVHAIDLPAVLRMNVARDEDKLDGVLQFVRIALQATPYLWTEKVRAALSETMPADSSGHLPLPRHVVSSRILPEPAMWWTFETGIEIANQEHHGVDATIDLMVIRDIGSGFLVVTCGDIREDGGEGRPFLEFARFEYGRTFPDDYLADSGGFNRLENALSFLAFLNSPYIPKRKSRLLRSERREVARNTAADFGEEVTFVTLRRPEPAAGSRPEGDTPAHWRHQWLVSGHYRAQWYPSESAHHVIWIEPHLKGPPDAPLLQRANRVAR